MLLLLLLLVLSLALYPDLLVSGCCSILTLPLLLGLLILSSLLLGRSQHLYLALQLLDL